MVEVAEKKLDLLITKTVVECRGQVEEGKRSSIYGKTDDTPGVVLLQGGKNEHGEPRYGEYHTNAMGDAVV